MFSSETCAPRDDRSQRGAVGQRGAASSLDRLRAGCQERASDLPHSIFSVSTSVTGMLGHSCRLAADRTSTRLSCATSGASMIAAECGAPDRPIQLSIVPRRSARRITERRCKPQLWPALGDERADKPRSEKIAALARNPRNLSRQWVEGVHARHGKIPDLRNSWQDRTRLSRLGLRRRDYREVRQRASAPSQNSRFSGVRLLGIQNGKCF